MATVSVAHLFQEVSDAIAHIVKVKTKHDNVNYLDDFLFAAIFKGECNGQVHTFIHTCTTIGMPVSLDKTFWSATNMSFLGLLLDAFNQMVCIPIEKVQDILNLIEFVLQKRMLTLTEVQCLCGKLNFICKAVVPGRAFTRRLYFATRGVRKPHHHVRLDRHLRADLEMWRSFLIHPSVYGRKFIELEKVLTAPEIDWYTDASLHAEKGCGGYCGQHWFQVQWPAGFVTTHNPSIAYLELYAVTCAVALWLKLFRNQRIVIFCDNMSVVYMLNSNTSQCARCLILIRMIVMESMIQNVRLYAKHVKTKENDIADSISRFEMTRLQRTVQERGKTLLQNPDLVPPQLLDIQHLWDSGSIRNCKRRN